MKVVVAIDSFKGSLSSLEAGEAVAEAIRELENAEVSVCPIADGGEGTVKALVHGMGGELRTSVVTGPIGEPVAAEWGVVDTSEGRLAVIEMAAAAGLVLVPEASRNPVKTTSYGVGELIREAVREGIRRFLIGIGGSATNDGGSGMLQALGYEFCDRNGCILGKHFDSDIRSSENEYRTEEILRNLATIDCSKVIPELQECTFRIACDVTNPLCGDTGCSAVYGPQKGATPEMVREMDCWLRNYAKVCENTFVNSDRTNPDYPGCGAAGGLGYAFRAFLGAALEPGIEIVLQETNLSEKVKDADLVITGEGRIDAQTVNGKAPIGVARIAKEVGCPVIAFCGITGDGAEKVLANGIDAYYAIPEGESSVSHAMRKEVATRNLQSAVRRMWGEEI